MSPLLQEVEQAIQRLNPVEQRRFLSELPKLLGWSHADLAFLKLAEAAFDFWDNPEDAAYDSL